MNLSWSGNFAKLAGSYLQFANPGYSQQTKEFNNHINLFYLFLTNSKKCLNILTFLWKIAYPLKVGQWPRGRVADRESRR
ncbi:MAG: hypothetical protein EAZ78_08350 [Oscillatoriales cyanobacterium]|nr:MAG: hypothetical protein EA000_13725 [Oscillatoriales cyanobacterium]TAD97602.1 MAG: hypothetical protein EAZ98_09225 [Oscillatoriales cyanobacterium]TAE06506.1 MAG: hypothetical protein EAZ96_02100 [Oscillatoriales cyanobacterium]TAF04678.1 MAG: hypothetical protein EAZ78_08350 [Oscillatoriales cyanobacterium]TAF46511.1 MAG: hypothetical protein EAZ68_03580 [Oscillatoriales cyanobacterium]